MRWFRSGGSTISGPPLLGHQAPGAATAPQPDPMAALMAPGRFGSSRSASTAREVSTAAAAVEMAAEMRTTKEATVAKATEEAAAVKVAMDKAMVDKVVADKATTDKAVVKKVPRTTSWQIRPRQRRFP
jgi:hypothetical protein